MYYENNARKLHDMADRILRRFGGLSDKDVQDFYSLANEVFYDAMLRYNGEQPFDGFLYSCLNNKFKSEMTRLNRQKRQADRNVISIDTPIGEDGNLTIGDTLPSDFDMDTVIEKKTGGIYDEKVERYLSSLSRIQRQIVEMKMDDVPVSVMKEQLHLSDKQYEKHWNVIRSYERISILGISNGISNELADKGGNSKMQITQTMEKSKPDRLSIASIIKRIDKQTIRFDHPLQRESEQWSPSMKGNLISDILQGNPIPTLVFAEQIVNGIAIIWDLDGKQRCTNAYSFSKDAYKITKNIRRWLIEYQAPVYDSMGNPVFDEDHFPVYEKRSFDIRGKKYSELPEELQDKFNDYNFEIVQYLNCSSEDIAYHIARYNEGKPMTASQKGITRLEEEFAGMVKSISSMPFFKDLGGYKVSEFKNGTINRVVVESVMAANFLNDWKKKLEDMCEYIKNNATSAHFDHFEDMAIRLEKVITDDVANMFDSKDSFLWFGLFSKFLKTGAEDKRFVDFMAEFAKSLHKKKLGGTSFDDLNGKSTKDKAVVLGKMEHLEKLLYEFMDVKKEQVSSDDVLAFVRENVSTDITREDIALYEDCLSDLTLHVDHKTHLLDRQNHRSLIAIIAYSCQKDILVDKWFLDHFQNHNDYIHNQKENYLHMVKALNQFEANRNKKSA